MHASDVQSGVCSWPAWSAVQSKFRSAVSLHGHTLHSRESLSFIQKAVAHIPAVGLALNHLSRHHRKIHGTELDMSRGWWTPPLGAREAWLVEKDQIEKQLELNAMVSLTDHDNIDAPLQLRILSETRHIPISVEWTVPYRETFFHIGMHNLPASRSTSLMKTMLELTERGTPAQITEFLEEMNADRQVLIVFNHPLWDESGAGAALHRSLAKEFLEKHFRCLHGLELNGLRPKKENRAVSRWAQERGVPMISGGDRHGREPNACLNLTNASTFSQFVSEVRDGFSQIVLMPQYDEPHGLRVTHNVYDVLRHDENHSMGWRRWSDRVFCPGADGVERSLSELWGGRGPYAIQYLVELIGLVGHAQIRGALRTGATREEVL